MVSYRRSSKVLRRFPIVVLTLPFVGCGEAPGDAPASISFDSDQLIWQSPEGAFWEIADVLEKDDMIWVLSPADPFVHGLRSGAEVVAFGNQGDGPGEFRSARALLPLGDAGHITVWDAGARLYRTFSSDGAPVSTRDASAIGSVRGDIDAVTFGAPLRVEAATGGKIVKAEFPGAVRWGGDLWTATLLRSSADGTVERTVDFGDLRGASHEDLRTKSILVLVPLWDACPDGSVVVLDPIARSLYLIDSSWAERDSLLVRLDVAPLTRTDRLNYLQGQMESELRGQQIESSEMEAMLASAEEGSRDQFPVLAPLAVDIKCSQGGVWVQKYDGASHPLGFGRTWHVFALAGSPSAYTTVTLPPGFRLFRVSDSHLLGVVTDDMDLQRVASISLPESLRFSAIGR